MVEPRGSSKARSARRITGRCLERKASWFAEWSLYLNRETKMSESVFVHRDCEFSKRGQKLVPVGKTHPLPRQRRSAINRLRVAVRRFGIEAILHRNVATRLCGLFAEVPMQQQRVRPRGNKADDSTDGIVTRRQASSDSRGIEDDQVLRTVVRASHSLGGTSSE